MPVVKYLLTANLFESNSIDLELDNSICPITVKLFLESLPFTVGLNIWGEELYTDPTPVITKEENSTPKVDLFDVAYWPSGKAICLFYGHTPLGNKNEIVPYSPVNVIGKILNPDKKILSTIKKGSSITFKKN